MIFGDLSRILGVVAAVSCIGCAKLHDIQRHCHTRQKACLAWSRAECGPQSGPLARHFERGWKDGYCDVANGGDGCLPLLPPDEYWTCKYDGPEGHEMIESWRLGYQLGAAAADQDGAGQWHYLPFATQAAHWEPAVGRPVPANPAPPPAENRFLPAPVSSNWSSPLTEASSLLQRLPPTSLRANRLQLAADMPPAESARVPLLHAHAPVREETHSAPEVPSPAGYLEAAERSAKTSLRAVEHAGAFYASPPDASSAGNAVLRH